MYSGIPLSGLLTVEKKVTVEVHVEIRPTLGTREGVWKSPIPSGCFIYTEMGELVPFVQKMLQDRAALENTPRDPLRGRTFNGEKGANVFIEMSGAEGKMYYNDYKKFEPGIFQPEYRKQASIFKPKNVDSMNQVLASFDGTLKMYFEPDAPLSTTDNIYRNVVAGTISKNGEEFSFITVE